MRTLREETNGCHEAGRVGRYTDTSPFLYRR
ncbi:hypothetical protein J2X68_007195 [Streptomyces sp. 3330]|nr:hypothetical protein [Streptomyces sp. 3330]